MTDSITFTRDMAQAIWDGRKTQTRRVLKPQPRSYPTREKSGIWTDHAGIDEFSPGYHRIDVRTLNIKHKPGDALRVREPYWEIGRWKSNLEEETPTGRSKRQFVGEGEYQFHEPPFVADRSEAGWHKRLARFMPAAYARQSIRITDVRVQRVQDISEDDAKAEGGKPMFCYPGSDQRVHSQPTYRMGFARLWDSINAARGHGWDANPWVAAYTFEVTAMSDPRTEKLDEVEKLREALDRAAFVLATMPDIALRVGLQGTSQWDEIAGGVDLFGALDAARTALGDSHE